MNADTIDQIRCAIAALNAYTQAPKVDPAVDMAAKALRALAQCEFQAWLVRHGENKAVFLDKAKALDYAAKHHGHLEPLA